MRFVSVGGLKVTTPVTFRGVRVGRIEAIRLTSDNWVEADVRIYAGVALPPEPIVVGAPSSLFGEWTATIMPADQAPDDPNVRQMLTAAAKPGGSAWPGATLPDVGQLTAQASRIAADIAVLSDRVQTTFDSNAVIELRQSIRDFGAITNKLVNCAQSRPGRLQPDHRQRRNHLGAGGRRVARRPVDRRPDRFRYPRRTAAGCDEQRPGDERRPATVGGRPA